MCDTCGCNVTHGNAHLLKPGGRLEKTAEGREAVSVLHGLLHENDHTAAHNREHQPHPRARGGGRADHDRQRLPPGCPHGP